MDHCVAVVVADVVVFFKKLNCVKRKYLLLRKDKTEEMCCGNATLNTSSFEGSLNKIIFPGSHRSKE